MSFESYTQSLTVAGVVVAVDAAKRSFRLEARTGDLLDVAVGPTTYYQVMTNLDVLGRDRVKDPEGVARDDGVAWALQKYVVAGRPLFVGGLYQSHDGRQRYEARTVYLLHSDPSRYLFEETHWWLVQVTQMADRILDHLFDARRSYTIDDFSRFYRTQLNILGQPIDESVQESAVLSRLLYDLSSAFLMTGAERYFLAARAAVDYLREAFRSLSHDGEYCFWAYGRRRNREGEKGETLIFASQGPDDAGTIALYEQIYVLAGLTQFYRITLDWEVLEDIRRTVNAFQDYFWDPPEAAAKGFAGQGGYYSHLDPATMRPDSPALGPNQSRKNWNSIGDHIPAYLVNLILALDPLPQGAARSMLEALQRRCYGILLETSALIVDKFPDPASDFVVERFHADWRHDREYGWQRDRAVVGHNLKIAWNLTRCAFQFQTLAKRLSDGGRESEAATFEERSERALDVALRLADRMGEVGLDKIRGGVFDCVERTPGGGMPTQFAWGATKDFWQQEQGILAYLILHGATEGDQDHLRLARECSAFWNLFFLDRERQGYFFRTTENGLPIREGQYGQRSSHAIGYHAFELSYLAHVYTRTFVAAGRGCDDTFCLYFKVREGPDQTSINVLPDFMPPGRLEVCRIRANGVDVTADRRPASADSFQISLQGLRGLPGDGVIELVVEFRAITPTA
jgi:hypothetical protein